jgi:hypothetical protein
MDRVTTSQSTGDAMGIADANGARSEARESSLRIVEYTRFPRSAPGQGPRIGFTRDISETGMCLGVEEAVPIGSLLRLMVRALDGRATPPSIHRVVWCSAERDGRYWLGLELLSEPRDRWSPELEPTASTPDNANA